MIYLYLGIAAVLLSFACKGWPHMKDMIKHDQGEYEIHFRKNEEQSEDTTPPSKSAAEILKERYKREEQEKH